MKYTKYTKYTKYELWNFDTYNKNLISELFETFRFFSNKKKLVVFEVHFCIFGMFCIACRIQCRFLYIGRYFKDMFLDRFFENIQKCEQFSYELLFCDFGGFGRPKWSPPPHPRRQCQSSLPGEKYEKSFVNDILCFL